MKYVLPTILLLGAQAVSAQSILKDKDDKELSVLLNEVVVTGTGTEHYLKDAPVQTEVITGKALEQYQARSIDDLLNGLSPSLSFNENDMGGQMKMNGLGNDYILILINGRRMNGDVGGQKDLNRINVADIERVEIVKGAASSLYGSDAIAGVINIITKRNKDKVSASNTTRIGEHGDVRQNNTVGIQIGRLNSTTSLSYKHTDGWRNTNQAYYHFDLWSDARSKTVNRSDNYTLNEFLSYKVNNRLELTAEGSYYERWVYRPIDQAYDYHKKNFYYRNYTLAGGAKWKLNKRDYLTFDVDYGRFGYFYDFKAKEYTDYFIDNKRVTYYPGQRIKQKIQKQLAGQAKGVFYLGDEHTLNTGVEYLWENLESPHHIENRTSASVYTLSAYAQDEWTMTDQLIVTAGVRGVYHKEFNSNISPKLSAMYKWGDFNLRANWSLGFKAPTTQELYYNYIGTMMNILKAYYGNKDLKPQTSQYVSLGAEYVGRKLQASITGYYNNIHNMIALTTVPTSAEDKLLEIQESKQYKNLSKARVYGLDASFSYIPTKDITIGGGYSYTDSKALYVDDEYDPRFMQYIPIDATFKHSATLNATWKHSWKRYRLGVGIYGKYQSKLYYIANNDADGYNTWRINTAHSLLKVKNWDLTANLGVDNIFDYVDRTPFGYNRGTTTPGRNYYISIIAKFHNKK
ncbi:TonB-dependent receptor plug domain-containing protein [Phocaeicola sp.]